MAQILQNLHQYRAKKNPKNPFISTLETPQKTFAVCLDEDQIVGGGQIREAFCNICSASCYSFKTLKDHYLRQHPGTWASAATCRSVDRILFTKPSKECLKVPPGWGYQYYCPLPGCKYHVSQHQSGVTTPGSISSSVKSFPSYSLLKQHYSKMHAHRSKICERCGSGKASITDWELGEDGWEIYASFMQK